MTELALRGTEKRPAVKVSGRRLLAALGIGFAAGALIGTITYYAIHFANPTTNSSTLAQVIVVEVYTLLIAAVAVAFRPIHDLPLGLRFTSLRDLALALVAWLGIIAASTAAYLLLRPAFGSLPDALRQILIDATDVKRLQGQPTAAWAIAIPRGCLLVPLFRSCSFVVPCFSGSGIICPTSARLLSRRSCLLQCISIQLPCLTPLCLACSRVGFAFEPSPRLTPPLCML